MSCRWIIKRGLHGNCDLVEFNVVTMFVIDDGFNMIITFIIVDGLLAMLWRAVLCDKFTYTQ